MKVTVNVTVKTLEAASDSLQFNGLEGLLIIEWE